MADKLFSEKFPRLFAEFFDQYHETALWASCDDDGKSLDGMFEVSDLSDAVTCKMREDCNEFLGENYDLISDDLSRAGHHFWLTRNGHGAGFWDGHWEESVGKLLTERAKAFGECSIVVCDGDSEETLELVSG
jgi:hypothetical protein